MTTQAQPQPVKLLLSQIIDQAGRAGVTLFMSGLEAKVTINKARNKGLPSEARPAPFTLETDDEGADFDDAYYQVDEKGQLEVQDTDGEWHLLVLRKVERSVWLPEPQPVPVKVTWHKDAQPIGDTTGGLWLVIGRMVEMENESLLVCAQSEDQARIMFLDHIEREADWPEAEKKRVLRNHDRLSFVVYMYQVGVLEELA